MRIFKYNPFSGERGSCIGVSDICTWTKESLAYANDKGLIEPIECELPRIEGQEWDAHVDAGIFNDHQSLLNDTEWICFCTGHMTCGEDTFWQWIVLPPRALIKYKEDRHA